VNSHQVEPTEPVFELAAPEQVDVTPEIDEIGELLGHTKHFNDAIDRDAWTHGYPYAEKMTRKEYERTKRKLQIELLKLQAWVKESGQKIIILFEGRDAAGKGGAIKRFMEHMNPRGARVVALEIPTERERSQWYFQRYVAHLPSRRRDRHVRPLLVQPGRRRACHGLLLAAGVSRVHPLGT
jgi:hypothetical protein